MGRKVFAVEQIIRNLREVEVLCGQGKTIGEDARQIGVTEQTYYRWRKQYGGVTHQTPNDSRNWRRRMQDTSVL